MTDNPSEQAQQDQKPQEAQVTVLAVLIDVMGTVDWHRGFSFKSWREATADDLRAALARIEAGDA